MAVMLWEMLRGERCLAGESDEQTRENITRFDISQASRRVSGLSPKLSEIVRKNLDRDPGRRYTGAYQMLQRLAQSPEAQFAEQSRAALGEAVATMTGRIEAAQGNDEAAAEYRSRLRREFPSAARALESSAVERDDG